MAEFEVTYGFNVRRFIKHHIEAETHEEAIALGKAQAEERIQEEVVRLENSSGFGSHEEWSASMFIDALDEDFAAVFDDELPELDAG